MANWSKPYTCNPVNITRLGMEIEDDGLTPNYLGATDDGSGGADNLVVWFDAEVTGGELTTLDATVAAHGGSEAPYRTCFCYDCGCTQGKRSLATLTACPVCSGTDIQTAYHNDNLDATSDPTVDDDDTKGFCEGSTWLNKSSKTFFRCADNATGAAVWVKTSVVLDSTPSTNLSWNGNEATLIAGIATVWGKICMLQTDGKFDPADASVEATANGMLVFATETLADTEQGAYVLPGSFIRDDSWNWTPGAPLYLSETTGAITQTKPVTTGAIVRILGYAVSADVIYFNPDNTYIEVSA